MKQFLVYHNLTKNTYYYKEVRFSFCRHEVGEVNSYNHKLVLIINNFDFNTKRKVKNVLLNRLIRFLENKKN